jgi:hypothetical protein
MRIRFLFLCVSAGLVAGGFALQACGDTQSDGAAVVDAGGDVVDATFKDTNAPDVTDSALPCDPTADFLKDIPDGSLADGASTTGVCLGCAKSKCSSELAACSKDCACQGLAGDAVDCYLKGGSLLSCGSGFASVPASTRNIGIAVFSCLNNECPTECATSTFNPDGGADADADAPVN